MWGKNVAICRNVNRYKESFMFIVFHFFGQLHCSHVVYDKLYPSSPATNMMPVLFFANVVTNIIINGSCVYTRDFSK